MNLFRSLSLTAIGGSLLLLAILRLRKYKLKERYTILFLLIGTPFLLLAVRPDTVGWLAVKLGLQYTAYMRFDGASSDYDGAGRNASDNNLLYAYLWLAF